MDNTNETTSASTPETPAVDTALAAVAAAAAAALAAPVATPAPVVAVEVKATKAGKKAAGKEDKKAARAAKKAEKEAKKQAKKQETAAKRAAKKAAKAAKAAKPEAKATCSFEGCENKVIAKGLCPSHYRQQNRGAKLKPLRKIRDLVRLPMVIRIEKATMETLEGRVKDKDAISLYDATRQALETGVAVWDNRTINELSKAAKNLRTLSEANDIDGDALSKIATTLEKAAAKYETVGKSSP